MKTEVENKKAKIMDLFSHHKVEVTSITEHVGPVVTTYEISLAPGVQVKEVRKLEEDITLSLAADGARVIAPIPGRGTVGIEVPNEEPETVQYSSLGDGDDDMALPLKLGKTTMGEDVVEDLTEFPHLLMAGATGQGKSVCINSIIKSLVDARHPNDLKFLLIDPKRVELSPYKDMTPYMVKPKGVVSEPEESLEMLNVVKEEMDHRYSLLESARVRNIEEYNRKFEDGELSKAIGHKHLPYIVVVIDEFSDLMMRSKKETEEVVVRITQLARAVGIHLIIATQRPSSEVITGLIKANIPARISFKVPTNVDSRTILDDKGAEQLLGKGDAMLKYSIKTIRFQGAFIGMDDIKETVTDGQKVFGVEDYHLAGDDNVDETQLKNEDLLRYIYQKGSSLKELKIKTEEHENFYVLEVNDLWFTYFDKEAYENDKKLLT